MKDSPKPFQSSLIIFREASQLETELLGIKKKSLPATLPFATLYCYSRGKRKSNPETGEVEQTHSNAMSTCIYVLPVKMYKKKKKQQLEDFKKQRFQSIPWWDGTSHLSNWKWRQYNLYLWLFAWLHHPLSQIPHSSFYFHSPDMTFQLQDRKHIVLTYLVCVMIPQTLLVLIHAIYFKRNKPYLMTVMYCKSLWNYSLLGMNLPKRAKLQMHVSFLWLMVRLHDAMKLYFFKVTFLLCADHHL